MSGRSPHPAGARWGGESLILGVAAVAAYAGFAAVMIFDDGVRSRHTAQAGVPVDAVRAATAASRNLAAPTANRPSATSPTPARGVGGAVVAQAGDGTVAIDGDGGPLLQFIVKFEPEEATRWRDRYLADPEATRREWARHAASNAAFAGLRLAQPPSASGVATLEFDGPVPGAASAARELSADIVRRLNAAAGVDYAEPNLVGLREDQQ
jgi:hypothetical protein